MPLVFENSNPIQGYVCTFSPCQKALLKSRLRWLWDTGLCITLSTIFPNNKGLKSMYIGLVNMNEDYGLFSIDGTLQGDKFLPWLFTSWMWKFWGSLVTLLSCVSKYVAVLLLRYYLLSLTVKADVLIMWSFLTSTVVTYISVLSIVIFSTVLFFFFTMVISL